MNTANQLPDHLEQIPETPADPETVLTDEQLAAGGLVKVNAFMRSKASANALRVQKHREKKEAEGVKQINVQANEEARQAIKAIADRTKAGEALSDVLATLAGTAQATPTATPKAETPKPKPERMTSCATMRDREGQSMAWFDCLTQHDARYCLAKY